MSVLSRYAIAFMSLSSAAFVSGYSVIGGMLAHTAVLLIIANLFTGAKNA